MGGGFLGDIDRERRIVAWLLIGGFALLLAGVDALGALDCRPEMNEEDMLSYPDTCSDNTVTTLSIVAIIGALCMIAGQLLVTFSVIRTTGQNGEWLWFAFTITGSAGLLYYILDWIGSSAVKGVD
tara:strand:+ start:2773 stop:3150 length:378 start_codon:yes stop_codon:yes gene_type:complete